MKIPFRILNECEMYGMTEEEKREYREFLERMNAINFSLYEYEIIKNSSIQKSMLLNKKF